MKPSDRDPLLRNVLAGEPLDQARARSLAAGLGVMRRRRRERALLATAGSLAVVCIAVLLAQKQIRPAEPAGSAHPAPTPVRSAVRMITDDELLARFSDRPVLLVGAPGQQRLVFLDGKSSENRPR